MKNYVNWCCPLCWWDAYKEKDEFSWEVVYKCNDCELEMDESEFPDSHK